MFEIKRNIIAKYMIGLYKYLDLSWCLKLRNCSLPSKPKKEFK